MIRSRIMKYLTIASLTVLAASAQDRSVPIDNDQVRVLKVTQGPHIKTKLHKHDMNRVMIYLQPGKQTIEYPAAKSAHLNWKAGEALWSPQAGMHIAEITSDNPVTIVELELKNKGRKVTPPALDPLKVAPKNYTVELDNDQVRVLRSRIGAPITGGTLRVIDVNGTVVASGITVADDGSYSVPTLTGTAPYRIEACGYAGSNYQCIYSVTQGPGRRLLPGIRRRVEHRHR